ncbi:MAG: hypothetical protein Fur0037_16870 [Planctomycetota bacterium]
MARVLSGLVGVLLFALAAKAQAVLKASSETPRAGQVITITYSDPGRAGDTITVEIDNGEVPKPTVVEVYIRLDQNGNGSTQWTVPDWWVAHLNAPKVREITLAIEPPVGEGAPAAAPGALRD